MQQRLKQALAHRQKSCIVDSSRRSSAVLVPIYHKEGEYHIALIKRTEQVEHHKGQISFPGGAYEEQDGTLVNTALRECAEEIGITAEVIELLGELDDTITLTSGFVISPFVAAIASPFSPKVELTEVAEIVEVPILSLLEQGCWHDEAIEIDGQLIPGNFYYHQGRIIWGATARILSQLLGVVSQVVSQLEENKG